MKRILVTPAGRERYLSVLFNNLIKLKDEFDEWHLWLNTEDESDINFIFSLSEKNDFIKVIKNEIRVNGSLSIHHFFKHCTDKDSLYLRLDDDIVYVKPGSIERVFTKRQLNSSSLLLYGNTLNNVLMSHLQGRVGNFNSDFERTNYDALCSTAWADGLFAEKIHRRFFCLFDENKLEQLYIPNWIFFDYEWASINVICWKGSDFALFGGVVDPDEERWLTMHKTKELEMPNQIVGDSLFVHYAYYPQRPHMDSTDVLKIYEEISLKPHV